MGTFLSFLVWLIVFAFAIVGMGLSFGGVGSIHADCKKFNDDNFLQDTETDEQCDDRFRPVWWAILFGLLSQILTLVMGLFKQLGKTRTLVMVLAFVVLSTADLMDAVETTLVLNDDEYWNDVDGEEGALRTGIAGLMAMTVANWLIIIVTTLSMEAGAAQPPKGAEAAAPLA